MVEDPHAIRRLILSSVVEVVENAKDLIHYRTQLSQLVVVLTE